MSSPFLFTSQRASMTNKITLNLIMTLSALERYKVSQIIFIFPEDEKYPENYIAYDFI